MANEGFIIGGVALLGLSLTMLFKKGSLLDAPIQKTDDEILNILKSLNHSSIKISKQIDEICKLQRRKAHLHKDIQNTIGLFVLSSFFLISIGLESTFFGDGNPLEDNITKTLILSVGLIILLSFCFILRFVIEVCRIDKA